MQPHDVSDNEVEEFLKLIPSKDVNFVIEFLNKFYDKKNNQIDLLISKLRQFEDELDINISRNLALGIALSSHKLPLNHSGVLGSRVTFHQAKLLLYQITKRVDEANPEESFLLEITKNISSVFFAYALAEHIKYYKQTFKYANEPIIVVLVDNERKINKIVVSKMTSEVVKTSFEETHFIDAQDLYFF